MGKKETVSSALTPAEEIELIRKSKGRRIFERETRLWLNTGIKRLNAVLGNADLGIPYGKMIELFGPESHGKSILSLFLAALGQRDNAKIALVDLERSWAPEWAQSQGVDPDHVYIFKPEIYSTKSDIEMETGEEVLDLVEGWMKKHYTSPESKEIVIVDSLAALLAAEEQEAGILNQNMRTNAAQSTLLSKLCRRWAAYAEGYNAMIIFINQIRTKPGVVWGDPTYTPGGKAVKFYSSIRASVQRVKNGRMMQGREIVGLRGIIRNQKNKVGREGQESGFESRFGKKSWKFPSVEEVRKAAGAKDAD